MSNMGIRYKVTNFINTDNRWIGISAASQSFLDLAFEIARFSEPTIKRPEWMRAAVEALDRSCIPSTMDFSR